MLLSSWKLFPPVRDHHKVVCQFVKGSYLTIFDRPVRWVTNAKVMCWTALESRNEHLLKYAQMQIIKQTSTARASEKWFKPRPEIVFQYGSQDFQIKEFLENRKVSLDIIERLRKDLQCREREAK